MKEKIDENNKVEGTNEYFFDKTIDEGLKQKATATKEFSMGTGQKRIGRSSPEQVSLYKDPYDGLWQVDDYLDDQQKTVRYFFESESDAEAFARNKPLHWGEEGKIDSAF